MDDDRQPPAPNRRVPWAWILAAALAAALPYALKVAADHDLWWHVRTGQLILDQRSLPEADPFSFTAAGAAWTNHEWLSDVLLAATYGVGGDRALSLLRTGLLVAVLGCLAWLLWKRVPHPPLVLGALLLVTPLVRIFINLRPHGYTYLLTLVLLLLLEGPPRRTARLWLAVPLMALWTNLHGGFLLGLGVLTWYLAERWLDARDRPTRRRLVGVWAASVAAPLLNPYGPGLFAYLARELGADHSLILEWRGIWSFPEHRLHFVLLLAAPLLACVVARRIDRRAPLLLLAASAWACWTHGRFLVLLVFFSTLVTFAALRSILDRHPDVLAGGILRRLAAPRWAWTLCAIPLVAGTLQFAVDARRQGLRLQLDPWGVPVEACEFLRRHDLGPNLLLRFDWGGYAIWHLHPHYKVSGDGRNMTVYDGRFVDTLLREYHGGRFAELAERLGADVILSEAAGPSYLALRARADWVEVHRDPVGAVFTRPAVAATLAERRRDPVGAQPAAERFFFP